MKWILRIVYVILIFFIGFIGYQNRIYQMLIKYYNVELIKTLDEDSTLYTDNLMSFMSPNFRYDQKPIYFASVDTEDIKFDLKFYAFDKDDNADNFNVFFVISNVSLFDEEKPRMRINLNFDGVKANSVYIDFNQAIDSQSYINYKELEIQKQAPAEGETDPVYKYLYTTSEGTQTANQIQSVEVYYTTRENANKEDSYIKVFEAFHIDLRDTYTNYDVPTETISTLINGVAKATLFDGEVFKISFYDTTVEPYQAQTIDYSKYQPMVTSYFLWYLFYVTLITLLLFFRKRIYRLIKKLFTKKKDDSDDDFNDQEIVSDGPRKPQESLFIDDELE